MSTIEQYPQFPPDEPFPRYIQIPNPAAGAEILYNCPISHRFKIIGVHFSFTTDANVANRNVDILLSDAPVNLYRFNADLIHPAGAPLGYHLVCGQIQPAFTAGTDRFFPAPWPLHFFYGQTLTTITENIQVGDQFSMIYLYAFGWPDFVNNPPA